MSTAAVHATPASSWKQEVNRRLAEHRGRKPATQTESQADSAAQSNASRRAQEAAARVAARYAKAPSYSDMLANEARAALRAAEAASHAALQAKAAAQSVLDNIEAANAVAPEPIQSPAAPIEPFFLEPVVVQQKQSSPALAPIAESARKPVMDHRANEGQSLSILWAPELPARHSEPIEFHEGKGLDRYEEEWWKPASAEPIAPGFGEIDMVDPALPIHGNLIEFPRELVATRKVRPRLAEAPFSDGGHSQLSIFEVDPDLIATEPSADAVRAIEADWSRPAWSGLELDAQPQLEEYELTLEEPAPRPQVAHRLNPASMGRRIMALCVDGVLVAGARVSSAAFVLSRSQVLPSLRSMEHISAVALVIIAAVYVTLFYAVAPATPGMMYARIRFCTFEGLTPTLAQRWNRLAAMLLSVLPAGLGIAWSLFDDDNLSWHDRLSKTYICDL